MDWFFDKTGEIGNLIDGGLGFIALGIIDNMEILIIAAIIGVIPAVIARNKGRGFVGWWIYGALLFIVALPHALLIKPDQAAIEKRQLDEGMKKCPFCAEMVKVDAKVCRYCSRELS